MDSISNCRNKETNKTARESPDRAGGMEIYSRAVQGGTEETEGWSKVAEAGAKGLENQSDVAGPEGHGGAGGLEEQNRAGGLEDQCWAAEREDNDGAGGLEGWRTPVEPKDWRAQPHVPKSVLEPRRWQTKAGI